MSIFRRKNYVRRIDRVNYNFTLGESLLYLGNAIFKMYPYLIGVSLGLMLYYTLLVDGDGKWMSFWFSDSTKLMMENIMQWMFLAGLACIPASFVVEGILFPLFSFFRREWHNYTVLMFFVAIVLVKLQEENGWWLGVAAIPSLIFLLMLGWSIIVGILDLIF